MSTDCEYNGRWYKQGEIFPAGDGCNDCSCMLGGSVGCSDADCGKCTLHIKYTGLTVLKTHVHSVYMFIHVIHVIFVQDNSLKYIFCV